eukprot:scaffold4392_cov63-Cyclotella_meneghiniana.AAC.2
MDMERLEYIYTIHMKKLTADGHGVEVTGAASAAAHTPQKLEGRLTKAERWGREYWAGRLESVNKSKQIGSAQNMAGGPVTLPLNLFVSHGCHCSLSLVSLPSAWPALYCARSLLPAYFQ